MLAFVLPWPGWFRAALRLARLAGRSGPCCRAKAGIGDADFLQPHQGDAGLAPAPAAPGPAGGAFSRRGRTRGRVALLQGCAQQVLAPRINQAAIRLLTRHGIEVVLERTKQCCGSLTHHMGRDGRAGAARAPTSMSGRARPKPPDSMPS